MILNVAERTIDFHTSNITAKPGALNKTQAVLRAALLGLLKYRHHLFVEGAFPFTFFELS
jgi:hypothetical protein